MNRPSVPCWKSLIVLAASWFAIHCAAQTTLAQGPAAGERKSQTAAGAPITLENQYLRITVDSRTGAVLAVTNRKTNTECLVQRPDPKPPFILDTYSANQAIYVLQTPLTLMTGILSSAISFAAADSFRESPDKYWTFKDLVKVPAYKPANFPDSNFPGFQAILYDGVEVEGVNSSVFAYISYPDGEVPKGGFPAVLLVHGGGGTAYPYYIQQWNKRGYAVLAIDWYNQRPVITPRPDGKGFSTTSVPLEGGRRQLHVPIVGNIVLAHSLLRTLANVNPDKIGYVGLSWGSWYGSMVAALDPRFKFILQIYCGGVNKKKTSFTNGRFLHAAKVPIYWVAQTVDQNITPQEIQAAYEETAMTANKTLVPQMPHSHIGYEFEVCFRVADSVLKRMTPLPKLGKTSIIDGRICAEVLVQGKGIKKCFMYYTKDRQQKTYFKRAWITEPAELKDNIVSAKLPEGVYQCFLAAFDDDNMQNFCCGSSDILFFPTNGHE